MTLRIGSSEAGGTFHSQAEAIAGLFNRAHPAGEPCAVETSAAASIDNANRLDRGEIEFGFMASNWIGLAREGSAPFARRISLAMVAPANAGPIFFVALRRSPIRSIDDLRARRVAIGVRGSGMVEHVHTIFRILDIPFDSFTPVYLSFAEGAVALIRGEIDAQFQPPIPNRVMTDLSARANVRVIPYGPGQIDRVISEVPFYRKIVMEKGVFRGVEADVPQIAVVNVIVTHKRVPEPAVYDMTKTIADHLDTLATVNPLFRGLKALFEPLREKGASAFELGGVSLHPGALRAYRDAGWLR